MHQSTPLLVTNLSERVTEFMVRDIFEVAGPIEKVVMLPGTTEGVTAVVHYESPVCAKKALATLHGRALFGREMQCSVAPSESTGDDAASEAPSVRSSVKAPGPHPASSHLFVGDLSAEVNDQALQEAFSRFPSLIDSRVMWDVNSGKSRGYGFVALESRDEAIKAIETMNGVKLGSRTIRVNWANQKNSHQHDEARPKSDADQVSRLLDLDTVLQQSSPQNTTVYVGNLNHNTTKDDLAPLFRQFGYVADIRLQAERAFAFVKLDSHYNAALAIVHLQSTLLLGRPIRCSWGRDRAGNEPWPNATSLYASQGQPAPAPSTQRPVDGPVPAVSAAAPLAASAATPAPVSPNPAPVPAAASVPATSGGLAAGVVPGLSAGAPAIPGLAGPGAFPLGARTVPSGASGLPPTAPFGSAPPGSSTVPSLPYGMPYPYAYPGSFYPYAYQQPQPYP